MVKAHPISGGSERRRKLMTLGWGLGVGAGVLVAVVTAMLMQSEQPAHAGISASEARLREIGERQRVETEKQANRLREHPVGEGSRFGGDGTYLGAPTSADGLIENKTLAQITSADAEAAGQGDGGSGDAKRLAALSTVNQSIEKGSHAAEEGTDQAGAEAGARPRGNEGKSVRTRRQSSRRGDGIWNDRDEDFGATTALGYSAVPEATWAIRHPGGTRNDGNDARGGRTSREPSEAGDWAQVAAGGPGGGQVAPVAVVPSVGWGAGFAPPGPSVSGGGLYAQEGGGLPAERRPQPMPPGGVGDMRIGGRPIGPGGALVPVGPDEVVRQGKFLECALTHEMRVDLVNSPMRAQITQDFLSADGQYVLFPAGAQVIGSAGRVQNVQQARAYIKATRVIFPRRGEKEPGLAAWFPTRDMPATDATGAIGVDGDVDRHFWLQFGAAVMLGVLDGVGAALQGTTRGDDAVQNLVIGRTSNNLSNVAAGIIGRYGNVVATVSINAGAPLKIYFDEDVLVSPYMLTSELAHLREGRARE